MQRSLKGFCLFLLGMLGWHAAGVQAATSGVLCNSDLPGETQNPAAPGCVDVLAWSWGVSHVPSGAPSFQDVNLTKYADTSSDDLLKFVTTGTAITGVVEYREYDDCGGACIPSEPYLTVHLKGVNVTSLSMGGSAGESRLTESVSLSFDEISYCYRPTMKGGLGTAQCFAFSALKNVAITPF